MNNLMRKAYVLLAFVAAAPAIAQTTTGSNTSITLPTPPRSMASMPVAATPGVDSTFQGNVQPNQRATYSITLPWTYSGSSSSSASAAAATATQASALSRPLPARQPTTTPASSSNQIY